MKKVAMAGIICSILLLFVFHVPEYMYAHYKYFELQSSTETGDRWEYLITLKNCRYGKDMAREWISKQFLRRRSYGIGFIIEHQDLWIGKPCSFFENQCGTSDIVDNMVYIWRLPHTTDDFVEQLEVRCRNNVIYSIEKTNKTEVQEIP